VKEGGNVRKSKNWGRRRIGEAVNPKIVKKKHPGLGLIKIQSVGKVTNQSDGYLSRRKDHKRRERS